VYLENTIDITWGFLASQAYPKPHFIFFLDKKNEAKKIKTAPAALKKLTLDD